MEPSNRSFEMLIEREISRRLFLHRSGATAVALSIPAVLAACGGDDTATENADVKTSEAQIDRLRVGIPGRVENLDVVAKVAGPQSYLVTCSVLDSLMIFDSDYKPRPWLAESVTKQDDDLTYVVTLRPNVKWSDGKPLLPEDVAWSLQRASDPEVSVVFAYFIPDPKAYEVTGEREVTIRLKRPLPYLEVALASGNGVIFQKEFMERVGDDAGTPGAGLVGTGPYVLDDLQGTDLAVLERNGNFWGTKPKVRTVELNAVVEDSTRLLAQRSGDIEGSFGVPLFQSKQWARIPSARLVSSPDLRVTQMWFNTTKPPFDNVHVRRAFAYALDKEAVVKGILQGRGRVARCPIPREQWGAVLSREEVDKLYDSLPDYPFDLDKAKAELEEAGAADLSATVDFIQERPLLRQLAIVWAENLGEIGVTLEPRGVPEDTFFTRLGAGDKPSLTLWDPQPNFPDPSNNLYDLYLSDFAVKNGFNGTEYSNPKLDRLLNDQLVEADNAERARMIGEALRIIQQDVPTVVAWEGETLAAFAKDYVYRDFSAFYYLVPWPKDIRAAA
jgi:peptide/nickel transport system substrate-binding protein